MIAEKGDKGDIVIPELFINIDEFGGGNLYATTANTTNLTLSIDGNGNLIGGLL